ncbi:MAG: hypothetical protein JNK11_17175 [Alphaproteobacteria bacterium]|nr:hypothetical protein [Alphaproteobacteria bacterium]
MAESKPGGAAVGGAGGDAGNGPVMRPWRPDAAVAAGSRGNADPDAFAKLSMQEKVDVIAGMVGVVKQFGGDPKQMLRDVIRGLTVEQKAQIARDPRLKAQLQKLLEIL